jgi:hypothetical protein
MPIKYGSVIQSLRFKAVELEERLQV